MNPTVIVALIGAGALLLVALINAYTAIRVTRIGHRVDGRMDELLELTRTASRAAGIKEQKQISTEEAVRVAGSKLPGQ